MATARRVIGICCAFLVDQWRKTFAPIEFPESVYGILGCNVCRVDVHREGETCAFAQSAMCSACGGRVLLDCWGCPYYLREPRTTHRLTDIRGSLGGAEMTPLGKGR